MTQADYLKRTVASEAIKTRRSPLIWVSVVAPFAVACLLTMALTSRGGALIKGQGGNPWKAFEPALFFWSALVLPLCVTLQAALAASIEHTQQQWKHLFALAVPRWSIYAAKMAVVLTLSAVSSAVLWVGLLLGGLALSAAFPQITHGPMIAGELFEVLAKIYLASWLLTAVQVWIAIRWSSFSMPILIGVIGSVASLMFAARPEDLGWWRFVNPWCLPGQVARIGAEHVGETLVVAIVLSACVSIVGCIESTRRDVM